MNNRMSVTFDKELDDAIEAYRYEHRNVIKTKNKAINELLKKGMQEYYRLEAERESQKNKAPTAESAAEALYEVLFYYLDRPPTPGEVQALRAIVPTICNGIKELE